MNKKLEATEYAFDAISKMLTAELTYEDTSKAFIFILPNDMIFVADCGYTELQRRIDADECESYEAYDLSDGHSYYLQSEYAEDISDALLRLIFELT